MPIIILFSAVTIQFAQCDGLANVTVAIDGSGDFISIQEAINSAPGVGPEQFVIFIKNGVYDEKLFFEKSYITLIGEDRDSTIITTAVLRRVWRETNDSDWGAATVNISNSATDLTFANMTIRNNFADVFPDFPNPNDHTFAMRGGGHRVITINCNITTTGGDTLSLWNTDGGMFYHKSCFFTGYVDYIAPRGYCYMEDCDFYGYNSTASIWHDGSGGEDHKLVIRNGYFDGKLGFALGRHHRDAQFYLLDCFFTENMKNQEIYWEGQNEITWDPERKYYYNCHRPLFDWTWYRNNLHEAPGNPEPEQIDARWTFKNEWDPESSLDGLLPFAFLPSPSKNSCAGIEESLNWVPGRCVVKHRIFFGKAGEEIELVSETTDPEYFPEVLEENTEYTWRVDEVTLSDTIEGELWSFRTEKVTDLAPNPVHSPNPPDGGAYYDNIVRLDWEYDQCSADSFLVYFGTNPENLEFRGVQKNNFYITSDRNSDTTYFWRIDSKNDFEITEGIVWSYTYDPSTSGLIETQNPDFQIMYSAPNPFKNHSKVGIYSPISGDLSLEVMDVSGKHLIQPQKIKVLSGRNEFSLTIPDYKGLVLCKLQIEDHSKILKLISE